MDINDKLKTFIKHANFPIEKIDINFLSSVGVVPREGLSNLLFEDGVSFESISICKPKSSFLGAYSYMNGGGYIRSNVFIGRFCSIGRRVSIGAGIHSLSSFSTSPQLNSKIGRAYDAAEVERLSIKSNKSYFSILMNDVWVGDGAVIMPGVTVGNGAVIGANSVVTKDVLPYAIIAGSPAKVLRFRFPEELISDINMTNWWEYPLSLIKEAPNGNVFECIDYFNTLPAVSQGYATYSLN